MSARHAPPCARFQVLEVHTALLHLPRSERPCRGNPLGDVRTQEWKGPGRRLGTYRRSQRWKTDLLGTEGGHAPSSSLALCFGDEHHIDFRPQACLAAEGRANWGQRVGAKCCKLFLSHPLTPKLLEWRALGARPRVVHSCAALHSSEQLCAQLCGLRARGQGAKRAHNRTCVFTDHCAGSPL